MSDHTIHARTPVIQLIISQHNENCVLALLALNQYCVTTEEIKGLHCVVRQSNNGVIIVDGICNPVATLSALGTIEFNLPDTYIKEFGFFFFFRIAVAVSSACTFVSFAASKAGGWWRSFNSRSCVLHRKHRCTNVSICCFVDLWYWRILLQVNLLLVLGVSWFSRHLECGESR